MSRPIVERPLHKVNGLVDLDRCIDRYYFNIVNNLEMINTCIIRRIIHMKIDSILYICHRLGVTLKGYQVLTLQKLKAEIKKNKMNTNQTIILIQK